MKTINTYLRRNQTTFEEKRNPEMKWHVLCRYPNATCYIETLHMVNLLLNHLRDGNYKIVYRERDIPRG